MSKKTKQAAACRGKLKQPAMQCNFNDEHERAHQAGLAKWLGKAKNKVDLEAQEAELERQGAPVRNHQNKYVSFAPETDFGSRGLKANKKDHRSRKTQKTKKAIASCLKNVKAQAAVGIKNRPKGFKPMKMTWDMKQMIATARDGEELESEVGASAAGYCSEQAPNELQTG